MLRKHGALTKDSALIAVDLTRSLTVLPNLLVDRLYVSWLLMRLTLQLRSQKTKQRLVTARSWSLRTPVVLRHTTWRQSGTFVSSTSNHTSSAPFRAYPCAG